MNLLKIDIPTEKSPSTTSDNLPVEIEDYSVATRPGRWSDEDRRNVACMYVVLGNMKEVSKHVQIPERTLYSWLKADWWPKVYDDARREHAELIEGRLSSIVEIATQKLAERIVKGDEILDAKGNLRVVQLRAKDLNRIIADSVDKIRTLQNKPNRITAEARFDVTKIEQNFAELARKHRDSIVSEQ